MVAAAATDAAAAAVAAAAAAAAAVVVVVVAAVQIYFSVERAVLLVVRRVFSLPGRQPCPVARCV